MSDRHMLAVRWTIRDVGDVEAFCESIVDRAAKSKRMELSDADFNEAKAFLLGEVVVLERLYDPAGEATGGRFSGFLLQRLHWRLVDHWRSWYGRRGQHRLDAGAAAAEPQLEPGRTLSEPVCFRPDYRQEFDDHDAGEDRLGLLASADPGDDPDGWLATAGGLLEGRGRPGAWSVGAVGDEPDPRAPGGAAPGLGGARGGAARAGRSATQPYSDCLSCGWRTYLQAPNGKPGWHLPEACPACGADLTQEADAAGRDGGATLGARRIASPAKALALTGAEEQTCRPAATAAELAALGSAA